MAEHHVPFPVEHEGHTDGLRGAHELVEVLDDVEVGAADAAGERLDEDLTGSGRGVRHLVDDEPATAQHGRPHRYLTIISAPARP